MYSFFTRKSHIMSISLVKPMHVYWSIQMCAYLMLFVSLIGCDNIPYLKFFRKPIAGMQICNMFWKVLCWDCANIILKVKRERRRKKCNLTVYNM